MTAATDRVEIGRRASGWIDVTVADRRVLATGVVGITLKSSAAAALPGWTPGSHIDVQLAPGLERQYSLCGPPANTTEWRIAVGRAQVSRGGSALVHEGLAEGSRILVSAPRNNFPLLPSRSYVFVAGGIGITPILPMLEAAERQGATWQLFYGGRSRKTMAFLEELDAWGSRVQVVPEDECGLLDLREISSVSEGAATYCCGPPGLITGLGEQLSEEAKSRFRVERFEASVVRDGREDAPFTVHLSRSGLTLDVPASHSVLDVVEQAGIEADYSCREGVCGTCAVPLLSGEADHRDVALDPGDGDIAICVSRAVGTRIEIDL